MQVEVTDSKIDLSSTNEIEIMFKIGVPRNSSEASINSLVYDLRSISDIIKKNAISVEYCTELNIIIDKMKNQLEYLKAVEIKNGL